MKRKNQQLSISKLVAQRERFNLQPDYQRNDDIWSTERKQFLIDTILRDYDMPKIYRNEVNDDSFSHEIVDGQQRISVILEFHDGKFPLLNNYYKDSEKKDLENKKFQELTVHYQDKFLDYELTTTDFEDASQEFIREQFRRLQEHSSLNAAEKRRAMIGDMRDYVESRAEHPIFTYVHGTIKNNKRLIQNELIAFIIFMQINKLRPTNDLNAKSMIKMYKDNEVFSSKGKVAKQVERNLKFMTKVLSRETPEMSAKWPFLDLYVLIADLEELFILKGQEALFHKFFRDFESNRTLNSEPKALEKLIKSNDKYDNDLASYIQCFAREGNRVKNIKERAKYYKNHFIKMFPNKLISKDPKRKFRTWERVYIWRKAKESCQECNEAVKFFDMEADHIQPHSKGGTTSLNNAQCLCRSCNRKKSDRVI